MVGVSYIIIVIYYLSGLVNCIENCPKNCNCLGDYVLCAQTKLGSVPSSIPKWTKRLNLNGNNIRSLSGNGWINLTNLTELKLNKNKISTLTKDTFDNQKQLKILELNRNQLSTIEALSFKSLEQLTVLKLRRNHIEDLRDGTFFGLKVIQSLYLDFNLIKVVSKGWLYGLGSLKELSVANNLIYQIEPDAWEFCKGVEALDLSFNHLEAIGTYTFKDLNLLQKLILNNNSILLIEDTAFAQIPYLKELQLNNNKISSTIEDGRGVYSDLRNLEKFSLTSNHIKSINTEAFDGLRSIITLDMSNNNITTIQKNSFHEMPLLQDLKLNTTALICDCNLIWFFDWLNKKKLKLSTICAYPEWLGNRPLLSVPANNLTCDDVLPKPRFTQEPEPEIMALKGGNITLTCTAMSSSTGPMTFKWRKDNVELNNDITMETTMRGAKNTEVKSQLNIHKIQHSNAGIYQCTVSNSFGTTYSQKTNISVLIYPVFEKIPINVTVQAGSTARLECAAYGEPHPEIAWQKDGGNDFPAATERRMHVMQNDDVFFIINAKPSDMGVYSCIARNTAGTIVANATLTIEEKPSFVKPMGDKEVTAGESAVLQCMASGVPKPTIQWLKDGSPIKATERHFFTAEDQLMIIVDTNLSDAGTYICQLNNTIGEVTGCSQLSVKPTVITESDMWGIIIITVVCCAVVTSIIWVVIIYQTRRRMNPPSTTTISHPEATVIDYNEPGIIHFSDNTSEHSSCKDSGTGDSAKRSNDDLLPGDDYTLIINGLNTGDKSSTMRHASLVYLVPDGHNSHTPLLHSDNPYPRLTNHNRLSGVIEPEDTISDSSVEIKG